MSERAFALIRPEICGELKDLCISCDELSGRTSAAQIRKERPEGRSVLHHARAKWSGKEDSNLRPLPPEDS
ncbi:MAG: hypothetical protein ACOVQ0_16315, partial [Novosphingobium sp.]|uniref:hypothetical protein n=1 Tax=Novosphingobium sp. TaxID=1874826 RepID=UPI003B990805